jgi:hypothetical protein
VFDASSSALSPEQLGDVKPLLTAAASAYRRLYSTAAAAGVEVPYEANLGSVGGLVWLEQLMVRVVLGVCVCGWAGEGGGGVFAWRCLYVLWFFFGGGGRVL